MITDAVITILLRDQSGACWKCGRDLYGGYHVHHAIYTRDTRFSKWLDQVENLLLVCPRCHANHGILSKFETRKKALKWKIEHGYSMQKWLDGIPMLIKDRFDE